MACVSAALTLAVVVPGYQSSFASVKGTGEMVSPPPHRGAVRGIENRDSQCEQVVRLPLPPLRAV